MNRHSVWRAWIIAALLGTVLSGELLAHGGEHARPDELVASRYPLDQLLRQTRLLNQEGEPLFIDELAGRPLLISFMFIDCTALCPGQTLQLQALQNRLLARSGDFPLPMMLSISLSPQTDTPERLAAYTKQRGIDTRSWQFATGRPDDIRQLASALWVEPAAAGNGQLDHRMILHLLDSRLLPVQRYRADPIDVDHVVRELTRLQASSTTKEPSM